MFAIMKIQSSSVFNRIIVFLGLLLSFHISFTQNKFGINYKTVTNADVKVGAERTGQYFPLLKGKNIALVANQTSMIKNTHLLDSLLHAGFKVKKVFCPEHGFRGNADAGQKINDTIDSKTNVPIISLYGKNYKPKSADMKGIDIVVFDIQDVGVRFYTYTSTMHYVMEACAENTIPFLVLDRPNPNGYYVDGPVLEKEYSSFVGLHPVPLVHGMTIAEYACMINEEGWLKNKVKCNLKYVTVENYNHTYYYILPINPSPNLLNMTAVYLYPSLGLFEGTIISVGRGTDKPFQVIGNPLLTETFITFTPKSMPVATKPMYENIKCNGYDLTDFADNYIKNTKQIYIFWLIGCFKNIADKQNFFTPYFDKLAGNNKFRQQIINNISEDEIRKSWEVDINKFKQIRKKYLLYPDFE